MPKITPFLWFEGQVEEVLAFYTAIFPHSKVLNVCRYGEGARGPAGSVMTATFELEGQQFMALNGGPHFHFTPAISFFVRCESQAEIDHYWEKLLDGGAPQQCGWLTDRFGITWQIVPSILGDLLNDPDEAKAQRTMQAMLQMIKLDIAALQNA